MRQQCINSAEKAIGRSFNDGEVDFVDAAIARAGADLQAQDPDAWNQMSPAEQWRAAGQRAAEVMRAEAQQLVEQAEGGAQIEETRRPEGEAFGQTFYSAVERFVESSTTQRASGAQWWATISRAPGVKREELETLGLEEFLQLRDEPSETIQLFRGVGEGRGVTDTDGTVANALFYSPERRVAEMYAGASGSVDEQSIDIYRPLVAANWMEAKASLGLPPSATMAELVNAARARNHGALVYSGAHGVEYIVIPQTNKPEPVTREEVLSFIRSNGVRVEETVLGGGSSYVADTTEQQQRLLPLIEERDRLVNDRDERIGERSLNELSPDERAADAADQARIVQLSEEIDVLEAALGAMRVNPNETKWSTYTLPGGEGYREVLLRLPEKPLLKTVSEALASPESPPPFRSSHWDQPNVLAHFRMKEREGPNGERILALEEIQSDWHQAGRERGYDDPATKAALEAKAAALTAELEQLERQITQPTSIEFVRGIMPGGRERIENLRTQYDAVLDQLDAMKRTRLVPDAPFKNNAWTSLVLKRVIRLAADEGFDAVAWIPGSVKNGKYTPPKSAARLRLDPEGDGTFMLYALNAEGREVDAARISADRSLESVIGNSAAKKLMAVEAAPNGVRRLEGDFVIHQVPGWQFYDQIVPNAANNIGKKYGARVERVELTDQNVPFHVLRLTDSLREAALTEGLPLFARGEEQHIGEYYPALTEIRLGPQSNMSTFLHEMGHHFLEVHVKVAMSLLDRQAAGETLTDRQLQHIRDMEFAIGEMARQAGEQPAPPEAEGDVLAQAQGEGYEGSDQNEAASWLRAKAKGLDMSLEARMERARANWIIEEPLYRGLTSAPADPRSISPPSGDVTYASTSRPMAEAYADGGPVFEVVARRGKYFDGSNPEHMADLLTEVKRNRPALADRLEEELERWTPNGNNVNQVEPYVEELQRLGYIGMRIREDGVNNVGIFDPSNIRSIHAAFNPDEAASADLLAQGEPPPQGPTPPSGADLIRWFNGLTIQERTAMHEVWARMTERYFMEGRSPTPALDNLFNVFKDWLGKVYRSMTDLNVELSDEVRQVMDRLYVAQGNTQRAEEALGFKPAFTAKPAFMTEQEWRAYQELGRQATQEATADLGARTLRDMQWLGNAKSRELRKLQAQHRKLRNAIKAQVTEEIADLPVNRARRFIARGIGPDGQPIPGPHKLSISALRAQFGESLDWQSLGYGKYGMLAETGLDADTLAGMLGYDSGQALVTDLLTQPKQQDAIEAETDHRMQMQYGDTYTPQQMERQALDAVHNGLRGRFLAAQHAALAKAVGKRSLLRENARAAAEIIVGRQTASKLSAKQAIAAERKAGRAVLMALKKNDLEAAATASRDQLLAFEITAETLRQQKAYQSARALFRRVRAGKKENVAKNRNFDLVMAARAILSIYGEGTQRQFEQNMEYVELIKNYLPTVYFEIEPTIAAANKNNTRIDDMRVRELTDLRDTIDQLYTLSREQKKLEMEGRAVEFEAVVEGLVQQLEQWKKPGRTRPTTDPTDTKKYVFSVMGFKAGLRRVQSWVRLADGGKVGPWTRLNRTVSKARDEYRKASAGYTERLLALFETIKDGIPNGRIDATRPGELNHIFTSKLELLHAILHTGNDSNKRKLLLGHGWGTLMPDGKTVDDSRWRATINRMVADGTLTKTDFDFVQSVWDLLEDTKVGAQEAHRRMYGRFFSEITAQPVVTPFGTYRGGYAPAIYDKTEGIDAARFEDKGILERDVRVMFPTPEKGFTEERSAYIGKLELNIQLLTSHVDKVLRFTHLGPPVSQAVRVVSDRRVQTALANYDKAAYDDMFLPFFQRTFSQIVEQPSFNNKWALLQNIMREVRSASGLGIFFMSVVGAAQNIVGAPFLTLTRIGGVKPQSLMQAYGRYITNPGKVSKAVAEASVFMEEDLSNRIRFMDGRIKQIIDPNNKLKQLSEWFAQHGYFTLAATQNMSSIIVWSAAYDEQTANGSTHEDAVRFADELVKETQSSQNPEDISAIEAEGPITRALLTHMYNFFNAQANLLTTETLLIKRTLGLKRGMGRLLYVHVMGLVLVAATGEFIANMLRGQPVEDEDEDGYLDDWLAWFWNLSYKNATAFIPGIGQIAQALANNANDKPFDDRIGGSPAIGMLQNAAAAPVNVYKAIMEEGDQSRAFKDAMSFLTVTTAVTPGVPTLPFTIFNRPVGYALDVAEGDVDPVDELDYARGLVTGSASEASKNNQ